MDAQITRHSLRAALAASAVLAAGLLFVACGGNSDGIDTTALPSNLGGGAPAPAPAPGGGGGTTTPTAINPDGETSTQRVNIEARTSVPQVSLSDRMTHPYRIYTTQGNRTTITLDTSPSGRQIQISARLQTAFVNFRDVAVLGSSTVTTPHTFDITPEAGGAIVLNVFDQFQQTTLTSLTATLESQTATPTNGFKAVFHFCGGGAGGFTGFGEFNDLVSTADQTNFANDMLSRVNNIFNGSGITVSLSEVRQITTTTLAGVRADMVTSGVSQATDANLSEYGNQGVDESDPVSGKALDIFIVNRTDAASDGTLGVCLCAYGNNSTGGFFVGKGVQHHIVLPLKRSDGTNKGDLATLGHTLAHEIGHFLSLGHPTESDFRYDDFSDTPEIPKSDDANSNGTIDGGELSTASVGATNLMFFANIPGVTQTTVTSEQAAAMRSYLTILDHD